MNYEFEIRITSWDIENIINKIILKDKYILCKELGKENKNGALFFGYPIYCFIDIVKKKKNAQLRSNYKN